MYDVNKIRRDFPILSRKINGNPLVYFDNAATSQKPECVLKAMDSYYRHSNANVHRGIHTLANEATSGYEESRNKIRNFINAKTVREIVFTKNITEALNLVVYTWGRKFLRKGDEVILSVMEHHSNIVPWQILAKENKFKLKFIGIDKDGKLDLKQYAKLLNRKTRMVSVVWGSNMLGTINPVEKITDMAKNNNSRVLIDAAQYAPHAPINVQKTGCDFLCFTGHKMLGPMGTGVLWAHEKLLEEMPPFLGGGDMIKEVYLDHFVQNELPNKFEAGTPNVAGFIGLGSAVDYLTNLGMDNIHTYEQTLTAYALDKLARIPRLSLYGPMDVNCRGAIITFNIEGIHPHDVAQILDNEGIAIRVGHHCTMPLHLDLKLNASCRASMYLYNTTEEIDRLAEAIEKVKKIFRI